LNRNDSFVCGHGAERRDSGAELGAKGKASSPRDRARSPSSRAKFLAMPSAAETFDGLSYASSDYDDNEDDTISQEGDLDITSALAGTRDVRLKGKPLMQEVVDGKKGHNDDNDDEELENIILEATSKRNIKGGTEAIKKAKGKKITKGEIGGGSFQSMGAPHNLYSRTLYLS
jgi:hypothetical protein